MRNFDFLKNIDELGDLHYYCSNASTTKDVRHGYIDDSASKNSPTLTATGIPYEFYRIVVYMSTDTANNKFNYVTINGKNYTASGDALSSDTVTTIEGSSTWGKGNAESGGYLENAFMSSLVGFAPASDPEVLVYVGLNGTPYLAYGSAAPTFSSIMSETLNDMGVLPEH